MSPQFRVPPPGDVTRPEHEIGGAGGLDEARDVARVVGEVAVHLEDELGVPRRAPSGSQRCRQGRSPPSAGGAARRPREDRAASRSAISPVPSGESSSMTSTRPASVSSTAPSSRPSPRGSRARCTSADRGRREARHIIAGWRRHCPGTASSPISSTSSPTSPRSSARSRSGSSPTVARRRVSASPRARCRACARGEGEGAARNRADDRGEGRGGRRGRGDAGAQPATRACPGRCRRLHPAARRRAEDGRADLDRARRDEPRGASGAAEEGRLRELSGIGREERGEDPEGPRGRCRARSRSRVACSAPGSRPSRASSPSSRRIPRRSPSPRRAASGADARRSATST